MVQQAIDEIELSSANVALKEMHPDEKKEKADLEMHLTQLAKEDEDLNKTDNSFTIQRPLAQNRRFSASKITNVSRKENKRSSSVCGVELVKQQKIKLAGAESKKEPDA